MKTKIALALGLTCLLAVAVQAQDVNVDWQRGNDFSKYKTYAWGESQHPIKDDMWAQRVVGLMDARSDDLLRAIGHELLRRRTTATAGYYRLTCTGAYLITIRAAAVLRLLQSASGRRHHRGRRRGYLPRLAAGELSEEDDKQRRKRRIPGRPGAGGSSTEDASGGAGARHRLRDDLYLYSNTFYRRVVRARRNSSWWSRPAGASSSLEDQLKVPFQIQVMTNVAVRT